MPSSFILAPASTTEEAGELHLLPFSLSYSGPAPVSTFFRPRPAPPSHSYAGATIASFRGRALVAQHLELPPGYRGVILQADATNYSGAGAAAGSTAGEGSEGRSRRGAPLTPAPSTASTAGGASEDGVRVTRSSARGSGQVALARPRTRTTRARNKRIALSDEEDEEDDVVKPMPKKAKAGTDAPAPAPSEADAQAKEEAGDEERRARLTTPDVPAIVVLQATPGPSQSQARAAPPSPRATDASPTPSETPAPEEAEAEEPGSAETEARTDGAEEPKETRAPRPAVALDDGEEPADVRILYPSAGFSGITLWTPDAPMPGFMQGELDAEAAEEKAGESMLGQLQRSWWRQGGAGEGGDEFVRGLGEWIGLGEIVSWPLWTSTDTRSTNRYISTKRT